MKSVLFLVQDLDMPSTRVRVCNLLPELEAAGLRCEVLPYPSKLAAKFKIAARCRAFDIVVLQKKTLTPAEVPFLRVVSRRLVFDFDDAVYVREDWRDERFSRSRMIKFRSVVRAADVVIAGNRILAEVARPFNPRIACVPSAVRVADVHSNAHQGPDGRCVIGWVGVKSNLHHLRLLTNVFQRMAARHPIELRILSSAGIEIPGVAVRFIPWSVSAQEREIAQFDIGVMPLPNTSHAVGKCGYKALQCMAAAVPVVVSDVGVNGEIVHDGAEGFVAPRIDDFEGAIEKLIQSPGLRLQMGTQGRRKVAERYSIPVVGRQLAELLSNLA